LILCRRFQVLSDCRNWWLTTNVDVIPGLIGSGGSANTTGNDTIVGLVDGNPALSTLNAADSLHPTGANETLSLTATDFAATMPSALLNGISTLNVRNVGGNVFIADASLVPGVTAVNSNLSDGTSFSDVTFTNVPSGASVGDIGNGVTPSSALEADYVAAANLATINISGGTKVGTGASDADVTITGSGLTGAVVSSAGAANKIGTLTLPDTVTTLTINAATNITIPAVVDAGLTTIAAAGSVGNVSVDGIGSSLTTFTGGAGNDTLGFAAGGITGTQTLDGGAGTNNTLATEDVGAALPAADYTGINASTNFQTLLLNGAGPVTLDQSQITNPAFTQVQFNKVTGGGVPVPTVDSAVAAVNYSIVNAGDVVLNALVGQTALKASLDGSATASATAASILETGATTFGLASNGSFTTTPNTVTGTITLPDNTTVNITGSEALKTGAILNEVAGGIGETVNAGTFTGKLTVDNDVGNSKAIFTTGTGGSDITAADAAINNFTLGTGADKLSFLSGTASPTTATDTVTDFNATAGNDTFALGYTVTAVGSGASAAGTGDLFTDLNTALGAAGVAAGAADLVTVTGGTDAGSYLVGTTGGAALAPTDTAIHLAGLMGTLGTSNFVV
jgi:hypothetical protein